MHINCQIAIKPRRSLFNLSLNRSPWSWHVPKENVGSTEKRILIYTYINSSPYSMTDHINYILVITWSIVNKKSILSPFHPNTTRDICCINFRVRGLYFLFTARIGRRKERSRSTWSFLAWHQNCKFLFIDSHISWKNRVID